jgi:hypothetical protein
MGMSISKVRLFNLLRPQAVNLKPWEEVGQPKTGGSPVQDIMRFARYMGLSRIPQETMTMLADSESDFRYVFFQLSELSQVDKKARARLVELLQHPEGFNKEDVVKGLMKFLNNFPIHFPAGRMWEYDKKKPGQYPSAKAKIDEIARVLRKCDISEESVVQLQAEAAEERTDAPERPKTYELYKLFLRIFNLIVEQGNFTAEQLWR